MAKRKRVELADLQKMSPGTKLLVDGRVVLFKRLKADTITVQEGNVTRQYDVHAWLSRPGFVELLKPIKVSKASAKGC